MSVDRTDVLGYLNDVYDSIKDDLTQLLNLLEHEHLTGVAFPIVLECISVIDFFGSLQCGFKPNNVGPRTIHFITNWMSRVNKVYMDSGFAADLYKYLRCPLIHSARQEGFFSIETHPTARRHHLRRDPSYPEYLRIHIPCFAEEVMQACEKYIRDIDSTDEIAYSKLDEEIRSLKAHYTDKLEDHKRRIVGLFKAQGQEHLKFYNMPESTPPACTGYEANKVIEVDQDGTRRKGYKGS